MAKREVTCPFSGSLCKNCAPYIGRHYYRCFFENYRGYIYHPKESGEVVTYPAYGAYTTGDFEIPITKTKVLDPFAATL